MNVLLIGGTRYLGPAIANELLSRGHSVTVLHRGFTSCELSQAITRLHGDARDRHLIESILSAHRFDAVIDTILQAQDLEWLLPLLARYSGRLIHCGSTGVYAPAASIPSRETDPCPCPQDLGGFGEKLAQDEMLLAFNQATGFDTCSVRISNVIGAGDVPLDIWGSRNPVYYQRLIEHREIWIPNDGRALLQPVHVADLARGFCAAVESAISSGKIYNLSSDRAVTLSSYVDLAKRILNSNSAVRFVPMEVILAAEKANESGLRFICEHMCIDSEKARRELCYTPEVDVEEALSESVEWMFRKKLLTK